MEKSLICECGNNNMWVFKGFCRCSKCYNEFKNTKDIQIFWMRRFNTKTKKYNTNWEKYDNM